VGGFSWLRGPYRRVVQRASTSPAVYCCPVRLPLPASSYPHLDIEDSVLLILAAELLIHPSIIPLSHPLDGYLCLDIAKGITSCAVVWFARLPPSPCARYCQVGRCVSFGLPPSDWRLCGD
jgi:hypothetical protein